MVISSSQSDLDNRFAHLIQPIRDLTKNWDVNIANQLEEYLGEIEKISVTFDGGATTMNFAEAAMVIQGSACIYSRKVEYLYTLVYQVLDLLANKKRQNQPSSLDGQGNDNDANFPVDADEEGVYPVPRMPMALIPLDDGEKGEHPLMSKTGELLGSRNDFKMNTCSIHVTGTMLLDLSHVGLLENSIQMASHTTDNQTAPTFPRIAVDGEPAMQVDAPDICDEGLPQDISMDDNVEAPWSGDNPADDHDIQDQPADMETLPLELRRSERRRVHIADARPIEPPIDHWKPLDPHCSEGANEKPYRKGKPFRIPSTLQQNKKKRKRKQEEKKPSISISEFITKAFHSHSSKFPKNPLKVPSFPELEHLYWLEFKRRQNIQRKERKVMADEGRYEELAEEEALDQPEEIEDMQIPVTGDDDCEDVGDDFPDQPAGLDGPDDLHSFGSSRGAERLIVSSYEDLVRHHVDGFLASAQQYAQITELAKRVSEWEEKIGPTLKEEDTHPPFDIHAYGSVVIEKMQIGKKIAFKVIVAGKKRYEVCRLFLASLQLANNYNIEIVCEGVLESAVDKMEVILLSTKRIYEELAEYRAPSAPS